MKNEYTPAIAVVLAVAALHIAAPFLPASFTWGFHFLRFLAPPAAMAYVLTVALLVVAALRGRFGAVADWLESASSRPFGFFGVSLALFAAAAFVFRVDVPLLGDSWYLVKNFAGAIRGTEEVLPRDEPLATWYLSTVLGLFDVRTYREFLDAFFAGGMFLGALFLGAAFATVRLLFPSHRERAVSFVTVCAFPSMVLFFGYVETYAVVLLALSVFLLAGLLHARGRVRFGFAAVAFLAMALTHYLTVVTFPALAWLAYRGVRGGKAKDVAWGAGIAAALFLGILLAIGFDVSNYFSQVPHKHYLPLLVPDDPLERYSSPYTLFSPFHFLDLANLAVLLLAPAIGLAALGLRSGRRPQEGDEDSSGDAAEDRGSVLDATPADQGFLFLSVAGAFLFAFVAKFDLGAARDWDVLGPYAYPVLLLSLVWYFRRSSGAPAVRAAAIVAASTLLHSILWWTVTGAGEPAVARFRSLMDERLTGQGGMYSANLYLSRYYRQANREPRESAELWLEYIIRYPGDIRGFRNVLHNTREEGAAAAAEKIRGWSRAFGRNPLTDRTMTELAVEFGNAALDSNALDDAEHLFRAAIDVDANSAPAWNNLGTVQARRERFAEAAEMFTKAVEIDPAFADAWFNLGRALLATGRVGDAREAFVESARLGNRAARSLLSTGNVQP